MIKLHMLRKKFLKEKLLEFRKSELFGKLIRYVITGSLGFAIEYGLFRILIDIKHIQYLIANIIVYVIAFWFGFLMYKFWAFKSKGNTKRQLILYLCLFVFNLLAITGIMYLLTDIVGIEPKFSKIMVMGVVVLWNFTIYRKVIYK